jgi:hypothetical protein
VVAAGADHLDVDNRIRAELARLLDDLLYHFLYIAAAQRVQAWEKTKPRTSKSLPGAVGA